MLSVDLFLRFFVSGLSFLLLIFADFYLSDMDADRFVILLILLSICSGWFSYSYRQKVFIDSKKSERFTLKKTYILKVFLVSISSILILAYFDFNPSLIWLIFINLFVSFIYVSYWKQKKLYLSYASESIVIICMFVAILLSLLFSISFFELLVYCALVFLVAIIIFLRKNIKITLKFDQDSAIVSLLSFLIILISNIEVLAMENLIGSGDIVIFNSRNPHEVSAGNPDDSDRLQIGSFIGRLPNNNMVLWS